MINTAILTDLDDELSISTSNGGLVILTSSVLEYRADDSMNEFDAPILNVAIPQSLRMTVSAEVPMTEAKPSKGTNKVQELFFEILTHCGSDRNTTIVLMLSLMVILVSMNSLTLMHSETLILSLLSLSLATFTIFTTFPTTQSRKSEVGKNYIIRIRAHQYTSPDAPVHEMDDDIPQRFINGCEGDLKEARRRWDITRHWRDVEGVNTVLDEPQPYFFVIRNYYPHYHAGQGRQGHLVFYERPGGIELEQMKARGVTMEHLWRHWLFVTEYQWKIIAGDEMAKGIAVLDIEGVTMGDLTGEKLEHLKRSVSAANQHYPERSFVIFVVNAPMWFSFIWKLVKPLVHENTQKKVKILSKREVLAGMQEHIDISQIPEYYGGQLDFGGKDSCRFKSPQVLEMERYVRELNNRHIKGGTDGETEEMSAGSVPPGARGIQPEEETLESPHDSVEPNDEVWSVCSGKTASTMHRGSMTPSLGPRHS